jgi:hypothetical protein
MNSTESSLNALQRAQLTRSIQKLSKLLGTTPQLVDNLPVSSTKSSSKNLPAHLFLRHSRSSSLSHSAPCSPTSPCSGSMRSPHTARAARRRTIAKLSRTFGETVPSELVVLSRSSSFEEERSSVHGEWCHSTDTLISVDSDPKPDLGEEEL